MDEISNRKSALVAYALFFLFGWLGGHRFYLGRTGTAIALAVLAVSSFLLASSGVGVVIIIIPAVWLAIDAFLIPEMVRSSNRALILGRS